LRVVIFELEAFSGLHFKHPCFWRTILGGVVEM